MTQSQKLTVRASEIRTRLNEIAGLAADAVTDEVRAETDRLTTEYGTVETQLRAAIVAEDEERREAETRGGDVDAETRALRALQERTSLGRYLAGFADGEALTGAEKELAETRGLSTAGNVIPWDALLPPSGAPVELRADAVTPAPASGNPVGQSEIVQRVFARAAVGRLGVAMPSVPVGTASYPVIGTGQTAQFVAKDGAKDAAAGSITPNVLEPVRLQARVQFRIEDAMITRGLDPALGEDLRRSLGDGLDAQVIGEGDANVRGMLATAANGGLADYANPTSTVNFARAAAQAARGVDGKFAGSESECAWVIGTATYAKLAELIQANDSTSATERLRRILRDFMASANIPDAASNVQSGILAKLGAGDGAMNAVVPVWEGLKLIRDEVTGAASGLVAITAVALYNFRLVRPAAFVRTKLKLA
ncbi:MAG: phage major capsid protein [Acidobacteria bacterium]|nr:phage major capsid protein [Acidobacteriota bacterium]